MRHDGHDESYRRAAPPGRTLVRHAQRGTRECDDRSAHAACIRSTLHHRAARWLTTMGLPLFASVACANILGIEAVDDDTGAVAPLRGGAGGAMVTNSSIARGGAGVAGGAPYTRSGGSSARAGGAAWGGTAFGGVESGGTAFGGVESGGTAVGGAAQGGSTASSIVTVPSCGVTFNSACLQICSDAHCCAEQQQCVGDATCSKLLDCNDACSDEDCRARCQDTYATGYPLLAAIQTCQRAQCSICPGPMLDNAIAAFAQADCSKYQACDPVSFAAAYGSTSECVVRSVDEQRWVSSLPGVAIGASKLNACTSAYAVLTCDDYLNGVRPTACFLPGTLDSGAACGAAAQCASSFCKSDYLTCGVCAPPPSEAQACVNGQCGSGLVCAADRTCQRPRTRGEACSAAWPCRSTLDCFDGVCTEPPAVVGAACDVSAGLLCDRRQALVCNTKTNRCVATVKYSLSGQSCGANPDGSVSTCASATCQSGVCLALAKDHAACDDKSGPACEWPARCAYGICRLARDVGGCSVNP